MGAMTDTVTNKVLVSNCSIREHGHVLLANEERLGSALCLGKMGFGLRRVDLVNPYSSVMFKFKGSDGLLCFAKEEAGFESKFYFIYKPHWTDSIACWCHLC